MNIKQIQKATKAKLIAGDENRRIKEVRIDSRLVRKGDIYIAIKGDRLDGHQFISAAVKNGAALIIVHKKVDHPKDVTILRVKNTTVALGQIASMHRDQFSIPIIAITGSTGKTTTKNLIGAVLKSRYRVLISEKSFNNHIGVPLTLLKLKARHQMAVIECGTNQPGDIRYLSKIVKPTVTILTNIGHSHLKKLKTRRGVFTEKRNLIKDMQSKGVVILNNDDDLLRALKDESVMIKRFSRHSRTQNRATSISIIGKNRVEFKVNGKKYAIRSFCTHNVDNALAAICCGQLFKIGYNNIHNSINRHVFKDGRAQLQKVGGISLIDDTYNANPLSFNSVVDSLSQMPCKGRKIVIASDMLELGESANKLHSQLGDQIAGTSIDCVLSFGKKAIEITKQIKHKNCDIHTKHFKNRSLLNQYLFKYLKRSDVVLIKGSRSMQMEITVNYLLGKLS